MATPVPENQSIILVDSSGGERTIQLPAVSSSLGRLITIMDGTYTAATSNVIVQTSGSDTLLNFTATSNVFGTNGFSVTFMAGPSNNWNVVNYFVGNFPG
jgi:hypothetical protein